MIFMELDLGTIKLTTYTKNYAEGMVSKNLKIIELLNKTYMASLYVPYLNTASLHMASLKMASLCMASLHIAYQIRCLYK